MRAIPLLVLTAALAAVAGNGAAAEKVAKPADNPTRTTTTSQAVDETTTASVSPPVVAAKDDPYEALGIRAGGFVLYPSLTITGGYTTNAAAGAGGGPAVLGILAPELFIQSDWERHEVTLDFKGSYTHFSDGVTPDDPRASVDATATIDLPYDWSVDLAAGAAYKTDDIEDPAFPAGADTLPPVVDLTSSAALNGTFGARGTFTIEGIADRTTYQNATSGGVIVDQSDRNNSVFGARLRVGYEATPVLTPFIEGEVDRRIYDQTVDHNGLQRGSVETSGRVGVAFDRGPLVTGEVSVGTTSETFDDPTLSAIQALTFDGNLVWSPTKLTTVTFDGSTTLNPSVDPASSGSVVHDGSVEVAYAWRDNVTLKAKGEVSSETFQGVGQTDNTYDATLSATWKLNRTFQLTGSYVHEWLDSTDPTTNYQSDTVQLELRAQR